MAPKYRPISFYEGQILDEDIPELKELLENFKGDDNLFDLYLQDFYEKKAFKEGKYTEPTQIPTKCGVAPQNQPYECYETQVLKRDTPELKDAYDKYHAKDLQKFNKNLDELIKKKKIFTETNK